MYSNEFYHMIKSVMVGPHAGATLMVGTFPVETTYCLCYSITQWHNKIIIQDQSVYT